jgi:serine phosphatase RsbU (regulator of sigma subunit)
MREVRWREARLVLRSSQVAMKRVSRDTSELMPWKDPLKADVPALRNGDLGAVYYGQRRSGDFYDFVRCSPDRVSFGLFDVAGKLEQARPVMYALQQKFRSLSAKLFAERSGNEMESMIELWIQLNREVLRSASGVHACAAFMGCYNEHLRTLAYVNAGHTPGLVRDQGEIAELKATALPLGLFSHSVPEASMIALGSGHLMLLVSKGIVEARRRGDEFGLERTKEYLLGLGMQTAHETCLGLLSRVQQFMQTAPTHNDVTALSLVRSS